ncbi:unnamed protein product [Sphagnum balticum]
METCSTTLISRACSIGRIVETVAAVIDLQGINVIELPPRPAWMASGRRDDGEAVCSSRREWSCSSSSSVSHLPPFPWGWSQAKKVPALNPKPSLIPPPAHKPSSSTLGMILNPKP